METVSGCPRCFSHYVHYSQPKSAVERILAWIGVRPHRCSQCFRRYWI